MFKLICTLQQQYSFKVLYNHIFHSNDIVIINWNLSVIRHFNYTKLIETIKRKLKLKYYKIV